MSANVEVSERVYFPLCCSLKNTVYATVISSSTDTLAVRGGPHRHDMNSLP